MNMFPNLSAAKMIGYDLETSDPYLTEDGPGWARGVGYVLGCALAVDRQNCWWIPLGENPDPNNIRYLQDTLGTDIPKVGANLQYDYGWLSEIDIWPKGLQLDVQFAEALLDDILVTDSNQRRSIALDALAKYYLGIGKKKTAVEAYCKEKWPWSKDFRENLYRCPEQMVADYAKPDAWLPIEIIKLQWDLLKVEKLTDLMILECKLIPLLVKMRRRGLPIDETAALETKETLLTIEKISQKIFNDEVGFNVNINSSKDLAKVFTVKNIPYTKTVKGNPSFTAGWLNACEEPIAQQILEIRKTQKLRSTFIENAILSKNINGKIYPSLHPLRGDDNGTVSGRFSSSLPNGQQIPKRDSKWASTIRGMFVPEEGYTHWISMDLSQIEYRFFAHYSNDPSLIAAYQDPHTDFHAYVESIVGGDFPRVAYKTINFMLLYGGGKSKLTKMLASLFHGRTDAKEFALHIYETYQQKFPAAAKLLKSCAEEATTQGYIRTILGRKARFTLWEERAFGKSTSGKFPKNIASSKFNGNIQLADTYKAVNRRLQGSAADLMKKAMVDADEAGIFERTGYPHLTVHDELDFSYHADLKQDFMELKELVETCIPGLRVPIVMGADIGPDWGHLTTNLLVGE